MKNIILSIILTCAFIIRFWSITSLPSSLYSDEVDIGYQAYTFIQNQTDYFGNWFPIHFHSFADWQPGLGIYVSSLILTISHNPELSVRLPSAIFGVLSILVIYLITKSYIPCILLAISPWAIHYSRTGFAVSGMLFILLLGIYFWQKFIFSKKILNLYLSIIFFILSPYFYSTAKLFIVFIPFILFSIWYKEIFRINLKTYLLPIIFGLILLSPMVIDTVSGKSGFRFSYISIFTEPHREQITDTLRYQDAATSHPGEIGIKTTLLSMALHNKYELVLEKFVNNYLASFSTNFLFITGDKNARHGFGNYGLVYVLDGIFLLIGLFILFSEKQKNKLSLLFLWLLIFSPIPFALTRDSDSPHATRLILILPSIIYFSYIGIQHLFSRYKYLLPVIILLYAFSAFNFAHYYIYHYAHNTALVWHTGMKEAVVSTNEFSAHSLVFSNSYESFLPFFLLYHPYNLPYNNSIQNHLIQTSNTSFSGQVLDNKYYFGNINWTNLSNYDKNTIYIVSMTEYKAKKLENFKILQTIEKKYTNQEGFYLIKTNEN